MSLRGFIFKIKLNAKTSDGDGYVHTSGISGGTIRRLESAGVGATGDSTGTSGGTIRRLESAGVGLVSMSGTGGSTIRRLQSAAVGLMVPSGTSSGTIRRLTSDSEGYTTIAGTSGGTIRRLRGANGARYDITIKSRPLYCGPQRKSFGEVFYLAAYCEFRDTNDYTITLLSDYYRFLAEGDYVLNESVVSNQAAVGQPFFRHHIKITPPEGFWGSFFQYLVVKAVPTSGLFKWFGADIMFIPKPYLESEFIANTGAIQNGW